MSSVPEPLPLYSPLQAVPEATSVTVRSLVQRVLQGRVRVPAFQRPLRWRKRHVQQLLDSVWRGYPLGTLLFWRRPAEADSIQIGSARIEAPEVPDAWWLVDGQQRTVALTAALGGLSHQDERWTGYFDPDRLIFESGPISPDREGLDVPWAVLGDLRRLAQWIRTYEVEEERVEAIELAQQRLLDYAIPAYVLETQTEEALRAVFARTNSTGVQMRADEVFQALLGRSGPRQLDLDRLQADCDIEGFGSPDRADVMKAVLAIAGLDPTRRLHELAEGDLARLPTPEQASDALTRTVEFLRVDAGIPHVRLVPYPVVLVVLARWFAVHTDGESPTHRMLARWLWQGVASGTHQRNEVSRLRDQLRAIDGDDPQCSLDRLFAQLGARPGGPWALRAFNLKNARSRTETLALLHRGPCDRAGPVSQKALLSSNRVAREIFAAPDLARQSEEVRRLGKTAANRVVLDAAHTGLQAELRRLADDEGILSSHLIDAPTRDALLAKNVGDFLRLRAEAVRVTVDRFLSVRAAWDEPFLRPLHTYLDDEDSIEE